MSRLTSSLRLKTEQWLVIFAQSAEIMGGIIFFKLLAVYLTKAEFGDYLLATSIMALVLLVSFSVIDQGLMRFVSIYEAEGKLPEMYSAYLFGITILVVIFALSFLSLGMLVGFETRWGGIFVGLMCWILTEPLKNTALSVSNAIRDRAVIAGAKALDQLIRASLVLSTAIFLYLDNRMVLILISLSGVCVAILLLLSQRGILGRFHKKSICKVYKDALSFSWPLFVWGIFGWFAQMSNRWLLEFFDLVEDVANFGVLTSLSTLPFTMILGIVASYALPLIYQDENITPGSARTKVYKILRRLLPLLVSVVLIWFIFHRDIILLAATEDYLENSWMLPYMAVGVALSTLGTVMTYKDFAANQTRRLILPNVLPGTFSLLSGLILIPIYGLNGAIASFILAHTLSFFMQLLVFIRR